MVTGRKDAVYAETVEDLRAVHWGHWKSLRVRGKGMKGIVH